MYGDCHYREAYAGPLIECAFPAALDDSAPNRKGGWKTKIFGGLIALALLGGLSYSMTSRSTPDMIGVMLNDIDHMTEYQERSTGLFENQGSYTLSHPSTLSPNYNSWTLEDYLEEFRVFRVKFHRDYVPGSLEWKRKFKVFVQNLEYIHAHNLASNVTYKLAPNQFADLSLDEFRAQVLTARESDRPRTNKIMWNLSFVSNSTLPRDVNWVTRKCVTPVKDQARCGSCWAFSSTGAIEGALCAQTGQLLNLSEQQLVDCAGDEGAHGCNGGYMDSAFRYVIDHGGLCSEEDYPYVGKQEACKAQCKRVAKIVALADIPPRNDKAVRAALALHGPVSVGIEGDRPNFQFYHNGVLDLPCGKHLNHAVLIVGYGHDDKTNEAFYYVKNSWGPAWGDQGYVRLGRKHHGKAGECGVLLAPTVPIVEGDHDDAHPSFLNSL